MVKSRPSACKQFLLHKPETPGVVALAAVMKSYLQKDCQHRKRYLGDLCADTTGVKLAVSLSSLTYKTFVNDYD